MIKLPVDKLNNQELMVLMALPVGSSNATKRSELVKLLGIGDRLFRSIITELQVKHGLPIGTCDKGYYIIDSLEDCILAKSHLIKRGRSLFDRVDALKRIEKRFVNYSAGEVV